MLCLMTTCLAFHTKRQSQSLSQMILMRQVYIKKKSLSLLRQNLTRDRHQVKLRNMPLCNLTACIQPLIVKTSPLLVTVKIKRGVEKRKTSSFGLKISEACRHATCGNIPDMVKRNNTITSQKKLELALDGLTAPVGNRKPGATTSSWVMKPK